MNYQAFIIKEPIIIPGHQEEFSFLPHSFYNFVTFLCNIFSYTLKFNHLKDIYFLKEYKKWNEMKHTIKFNIVIPPFF